jgi:uncharacterized membrane protein
MKRQPVSSSGSMGLESLESRQLMSLTPTLVPVTISSAGLAADPNLANYKTYDLQVTLDPGERWIATDMDARLTSGTFYNVSSSNGGDTVPIKQFWNSHPQAQFDTFVSASNFQIPSILGQYNPTKAGPGTFTDTDTNVAWGSVNDTGTGTFTVARLTVSNNASGTVSGDMGSTLIDANHLKPYTFQISGGNVVQLSSISGNVFNDSNGNGKADEGAGLPNIKVYLDKNNNGQFDSGEKNHLTDANGDYSFDSLTPGTYYVRQVTPTGYRRTTTTSKYTVVLNNGVNGTGKNFGLTTTALLSGTVFNDKNSNGKKDAGEGGLAGFTIWLDSNNNGKIDTGEKIAGTDSSGYWVFKALKSGTYLVKIKPLSGYKTIGTSSISIKLASGGSYTGRLFAEHKIA